MAVACCFDQYRKEEPIIGIKISNALVYALLGIGLVAVIAANVDGILPDGYQTSMNLVMGAMVAMLTTMFGISGCYKINKQYLKIDYLNF
ncbi:hypothetical protein KHA80_08595 [Anaerobacillus sp. HL2]|nr:hypothetical protein KHA80_08595 [Anaerobacillus sp. HL2]